MKKILTLIKREYWEHQNSFVKIPCIIGALLTALGLLLVIPGVSHHINVSRTFADHSPQLISISGYAISLPFIIILWLMVFNYCLSCLFDDRKDGSVLFWQSMPINTSEIMFSKILAAMVLAPLCTWGVIIVTHALLLLFLGIALSHTPISIGLSVANLNTLLSTWLSLLLILIKQALWMFPLLGWCMLCSSYVKRAPFLTAVVTPIVLIIIEWFVTQTHYHHYVSHFISSRFHYAASTWAQLFTWLNTHVNSAYHSQFGIHAIQQAEVSSRIYTTDLITGLAIGVVFFVMAGLLRQRCHHFP